MNILMITLTYTPSVNGVALSVSRLVRELRKKGHTVWIIGPEQEKKLDEYIELPTIRDSPFFPKQYPIAMPILSKKQKEMFSTITWDCIHVHHPAFYTDLAFDLRKLLNIPVVFTYHTQYDAYLFHALPFLSKIIRTWMYHRFVIKGCRKVDAIIAPSPYIVQKLQPKIGSVPLFSISSAGLPVSFLVNEKKKALRESLDIDKPDGNSKIFLVVSRLSREKNIEFVLKAFCLYHRKHSDSVLCVVGDGDYKKRLEHIVRTKGLADSIVFVGPIANEKLPLWYSMADVFVTGSISEVSPLTLIEAMSAGLPIVSRNHPSLRHIVIPGETGYTAQTLRLFADAMDRAYTNREYLSNNAFMKSKDHAISHIADEILFVYRSARELYVNKITRGVK
jgi:1,2-diacylglycerol 3-alpha-glucosyltransferase